MLSPKTVVDAMVIPDGNPSLDRPLSLEVWALPDNFFIDIRRSVLASYPILYTHDHDTVAVSMLPVHVLSATILMTMYSF
jgi:hypothetical protein